jgi:hypothetical protein
MESKKRKFIEKQKDFYKSIVSVVCPILQETVYFTSEGFNHLLYETYTRPRKWAERYMKLKCLVHAPKVIKNCSFVSETRSLERKIKGKLKQVIQSELVHEISKNIKIRVVVEKIGSGKTKFRSIMPHNNKSKPRPKKRPKRRF